MVLPDLLRLPPMTQSWTEPRLSVRHEGDWQLDGSVGMGLLDGSLAMLPSLDLGLQTRTAWGPFQARGFYQPVQDSLLSWVGVTDPYLGLGWGRVSRLGASVGQEIPVGGPYQVSVQGLAAYLSGDGVEDNQQIKLETGLKRSLGLSWLDFGVLGLQGRLDAYRLNRSHFTLGHGGYYSPQAAVGTHLTWDARTPEAKPWIVSMHLETGPVYQHLDAAPYFPLAPDGRTYPASTQWTWGMGAEVKAIWRVMDHVQVGAVAQVSRTPSYDQQALMLTARYAFQPRRALLSPDLP